MRRLLPLGLLLAVLLAVLLAAGCGGGDDAPQTREGFAAAADGVCSDASTDLAEGGSDNPQTPGDIAKANDVLADIYGRLADGIADVELPAAGAARRDAQAFVSSVKAAKPLVERLRDVSEDFEAAVEKKDRNAITATGVQVRSGLDAFRALRAQSDRQAIAYGLKVCGNLG